MTDNTTVKYPLDEIVDAELFDLLPNPWNPRRIDAARLASLKDSMLNDPDGVRDRPLIALPDGTVIAGNMRLAAAREMGWETIPTVFHDYDEQQARLVALRDNNSWGEWEDQSLAALLRELEEQDVDLELTGLAQDDIAHLFESISEPAPPPEDRGTDLAVADVSIGDPTHQVERGDVWNVGEHLLVCEEVYDGWQRWVKYLTDPTMLLVPYPTPTLTLTVRASSNRLLLIQPDRWLAGHVLDKYASVRGEESVSKVNE